MRAPCEAEAGNGTGVRRGAHGACSLSLRACLACLGFMYCCSPWPVAAERSGLYCCGQQKPLTLVWCEKWLLGGYLCGWLLITACAGVCSNGTRKNYGFITFRSEDAVRAAVRPHLIRPLLVWLFVGKGVGRDVGDAAVRRCPEPIHELSRAQGACWQFRLFWGCKAVRRQTAKDRCRSSAVLCRLVQLTGSWGLRTR